MCFLLKVSLVLRMRGLCVRSLSCRLASCSLRSRVPFSCVCSSQELKRQTSPHHPEFASLKAGAATAHDSSERSIALRGSTPQVRRGPMSGAPEKASSLAARQSPSAGAEGSSKRPFSVLCCSRRESGNATASGSARERGGVEEEAIGMLRASWRAYSSGVHRSLRLRSIGGRRLLRARPGCGERRGRGRRGGSEVWRMRRRRSAGRC